MCQSKNPHSDQDKIKGDGLWLTSTNDLINHHLTPTSRALYLTLVQISSLQSDRAWSKSTMFGLNCRPSNPSNPLQCPSTEPIPRMSPDTLPKLAYRFSSWVRLQWVPQSLGSSPFVVDPSTLPRQALGELTTAISMSKPIPG